MTQVKKVKYTLKEYFQLVGLALTVKICNLIEYCKVIYLYYGLREFRRVDLALLGHYFWHNPYKISKQFLWQRQNSLESKNSLERENSLEEEMIDAYGETPLTSLEKIASYCEITAADCVFELGCGRGRVCFWLRLFYQCQVVGIDYIPEFINQANSIKNREKIDQLEFRLEELQDTNFLDATVIYLYGTCYTTSFITQLAKQLTLLKSGTKVITVSYPLTAYSADQFTLIKQFPILFTWGQADVYLQIKN